MTAIRLLAAPDAQHEVTPSGARQAFVLLRTVFTIAPIAFGLDKFFDILTNWQQYLAPWVNDLVPGTGASGHARRWRSRDPGRRPGGRSPRDRCLRGGGVVGRHHHQPPQHR